MKATLLNLCSICIHNTNCALTHTKEKVWSCSDFDEFTTTTVSMHKNTNPNFAFTAV